jgi:hypothetical protein
VAEAAVEGLPPPPGGAADAEPSAMREEMREEMRDEIRDAVVALRTELEQAEAAAPVSEQMESEQPTEAPRAELEPAQPGSGAARAAAAAVAAVADAQQQHDALEARLAGLGKAAAHWHQSEDRMRAVLAKLESADARELDRLAALEAAAAASASAVPELARRLFMLEEDAAAASACAVPELAGRLSILEEAAQAAALGVADAVDALVPRVDALEAAPSAGGGRRTQHQRSTGGWNASPAPAGAGPGTRRHTANFPGPMLMYIENPHRNRKWPWKMAARPPRRAGGGGGGPL